MMTRPHELESPAVYAELVEALFTGLMPLAIMTATLGCVGTFVFLESGNAMVGAATLVGLLSAAGKTWLHIWFRLESRSPLSRENAVKWERRFAIGNFMFAAAIGSLAAQSLALPAATGQLLATGMLFGFCSGQVARLASRVRLCMLSICIAVVPCVVVAGTRGDTGHLGLAAMFMLFMLGSVETVNHAYREIRQRIATNFDLASVAGLDPLTNLNNRLGLRRAIVERLPSDGRSEQLLCVHCFDLDGFKAINDQYGHAAGDAILVGLASRLGPLLGQGDVAARMGGDEFVIFQMGLAHVNDATTFAFMIQQALIAPYDIGHKLISIGMSIGSCSGSSTTSSFDSLHAIADERMYHSKHSTNKEDEILLLSNI